MNEQRQPTKSWTKKDFKIDWFSGSGPGGQHRNKTKNCCRITHIETGMVEVGQNHRERSRNQSEAFARLSKRVVEDWQEKNKREEIRVDEVVRTYNEPDNRVKDHLSGKQVLFTHLDGEFDNLIKSRIKVQ